MKETSKIRIGIDIGTNSVGYAVVDENDELIKKNGVTLWGVRMFEEGESARKRRIFRGGRTRLRRRKERMVLLRDIFAQEIAKEDPTFYDRLDDSFFKQEDKRHKNHYNLFIGKYNDKTFNKEFPTIFHLRKHLMESDKKEDIRLIYLVIANMVKFRGNFLRPGDLFNQNDSSYIKNILLDYNELQGELGNEFDEYASYFNKIEVNDGLLDKIKEILTADNSKKDKINLLREAFKVEKDSLTYKLLIPLIVGYEVNISKLKIVEEEAYEPCKISLMVEDLEVLINDNRGKIGELSKLFDFLPKIKNLMDYYYLVKTLDNSKNLSEAMIKKYEAHKEDLAELKRIIKKCLPSEYSKCFRKHTVKKEKSSKKNDIIDNYPRYIGMSSSKNDCKRFGHSKRESFYSYIKDLLKNIENEEEQENIKKIIIKMENNNYLPRHNSDQNGAIPMQLNLEEMKIILDKQKEFYPFLTKKDSTGLTNIEKIISIFKFRVPYYVGHLSKPSEDNKNSWIVRSDEKIYPWNFDKVVNLDETAKQFIEKMQNKCTYLKGEDDFCLPKNSIIFSEYKCLSYLNKLSLNGKLISTEIKTDIFNNVFLTKEKVSKSNIIDYITTNYGNTSLKSARLKDLPEVNCDMKSYIKFKEIFGEKFEEKIDDIENIIKDITMFNDKKILEKRLKEIYNLENSIISKIKDLNYQGYSRLSKKLIKEFIISNPETGEVYGCLLDIMRNTNANLQEILYNPQYRLIDLVEEYNRKNSEMEKDQSLTEFIDEYVSVPSNVKRSIIQAYTIISEIEKILDRPIDEYYIETGRTNFAKKVASVSRYSKVKAMYDKLNKNLWKDLDIDKNDLYTKLENKKDNLRSDALYLYFMQLGKCMYSLKNIDLDELSQKYDIDHIYPQAIIKDDSLNNRVLTLKSHNSRKDSKFIFEIEDFLNPKAYRFYELLRDNKMISKEKYERLTKKELTKNELERFVNRQLVSTNQAVKALIDILKLYKNVDINKIIYSKSENISMFRKEFDIVKSRVANNFHHAHDAYLNVVIGGALDRYYKRHSFNSFTDYERIKKEQISINPEVILKQKRTFGGTIIWDKDRKVELLKRTIYKRFDVMETRKTDYVSTLFNKSSILPAGEGNVPLRANGPLSDIQKYGGINSNNYNKFVIVKKTDKKGKVEYFLEAIPTKDKGDIAKYLQTQGYKDFEIAHDNIKVNIVVEHEKRRFYITSKTNKQYNILNCNDRFFNKEHIKTIKNIEKYNKYVELKIDMKIDNDKVIIKEGNKEKNEEEISIKNEKEISIKNEDEISITREELKELLKEIKRKFSNPKFNYSIFQKIDENLNNFNLEEATLADFISLLTELLGLGMTNSSNKANLELIGMAKSAGALTIGKKLEPGMKFISESVTGYYKKVIFEVPNSAV